MLRYSCCFSGCCADFRYGNQQKLMQNYVFSFFLDHFFHLSIVNPYSYNRKHRDYIRHVISIHRTGPYLCKFKRKCIHTFHDRQKLLAHIKESHYTMTGKILIFCDKMFWVIFFCCTASVCLINRVVQSYSFVFMFLLNSFWVTLRKKVLVHWKMV